MNQELHLESNPPYIQFGSVTQAQHDAILAKLGKNAVPSTLDPQSGIFTTHGVKFGWDYKPETETLIVTGLDYSDAGMFVPKNWTKLFDILAGKMASDGAKLAR